MKKLFFLLAIVTLLLPSCQKINDRLDAIDNRLDNIENSSIATINQQIASISNSILLLNSTDSELKEYIKILEATAKNLQEQLDATNANIDKVESELSETISTEKTNILAELEAFRVAVNTELNTVSTSLETLKAKDIELDEKIVTLQTYVDAELASVTDWATATFATLEQYNNVVATIASIEGTINGIIESISALEIRINEKIANDIAVATASLSSDLQNAITDITAAYTSAIATAKADITSAYTSALQDAIASLETSMKAWVNEQFTGYYTIAEVDAILELLANSMIETDNVIQNEIDSLSQTIDSMKIDITKAYQAAITAAIAENNGIIDTKIANEITAINNRINAEVIAINSRVDALEGRIGALEDIVNQIQALDIIFENTDNLACLAGTSVKIGYTIIGGDNNTNIECFGDGGWCASIIKDSNTVGHIKVTAPKDAANGKVIVLTTSGIGGVVMKSLYFDEGVLTDICDTYEVDWEVCSLNVSLNTNLYYEVDINVDWLSIADTRAVLRTETLTFYVEENPNESYRTAVVKLIGECGDILQSFEIVQKPQPSDGYIEFADQYVKLVCVQKFDTNSDGEISFKEVSKVTSIDKYFFGDYSKVVKTFNELQYFSNCVNIKERAFENCSILTSITIPDSVTTIGTFAFFKCVSLTDINISNNVIAIGRGAFRNCESLTNITIPNSVTTIEVELFQECASLYSITIPDSVTKIEGTAFYLCKSLTNITIPDSVTEIGDAAFQSCKNLKSIVIPDSVTSLGACAFYYCSNLASVIIGDGVTSIANKTFYECNSLENITMGKSVKFIQDYAFFHCFDLISVYCKAVIPPGLYNTAFYSSSNKATIYVPIDVVDAYKMAWSSYEGAIEGYNFD